MLTETILIPDDLLSDARAGDSDAVSALWDTCAPLITQALRRNRATGCPTVDSADVAQEAARFFLETLHDEECISGAILVQRLARQLPHRLHTFLRAERRRLGRQVAADETVLERALFRGRPSGQPAGPPGRQITRALERLSPRQRAIIAGLYSRDLDVRSLAKELGVSPQAVTALHRRALVALREALTPAEEEGVE